MTYNDELVFGGLTARELRSCKPTRNAELIKLPERVGGCRLPRDKRKIALSAPGLLVHPEARENARRLAERWRDGRDLVALGVAAVALAASGLLGVREVMANLGSGGADFETNALTSEVSGTLTRTFATTTPSDDWTWWSLLPEGLVFLWLLAAVTGVAFELTKSRWTANGADELRRLVEDSTPPAPPSPPTHESAVAALDRAVRVQVAFTVALPVAIAAGLAARPRRSRLGRRR